MTKKTKIRRLTVCLLSHHPLVLEEFRKLLSSPHLKLQPQRLDASLATDLRHLSLPRATVYVIDADAPRPAVQALVQTIAQRFPRACLVVAAEALTESNSFPLLSLGVKGLLGYAQACKQLPRAVRAVASGGYWVPRRLLSRFVGSMLKDVRARRPLGALARLSRREKEVFDTLLENLSNKEIASKLYISERTVKFHVSNVLAKFGVRRRADLILLCYQRESSAS